MTACRLTITTTADGKETEISRNGKMNLTKTSAELYYRDEAAEVFLLLQNGVVTIERKGDYTLRLLLKKNEICDGTIGLNGSEGTIKTHATRLAYSLTDGTLLLSLQYTLLIGDEPQKMKIRLFAKTI